MRWFPKVAHDKNVRTQTFAHKFKPACPMNPTSNILGVIDFGSVTVEFIGLGVKPVTRPSLSGIS